MISIATQEGVFIRSLPSTQSEQEWTLGFHSFFGLISVHTLSERMESRKIRGLSQPQGSWLFQFKVARSANASLKVESIAGCEGCETGAGKNRILKTPIGNWVFTSLNAPGNATEKDSAATIINDRAPIHSESRNKTDRWLLAAILLVLLLFIFLPDGRNSAIQTEAIIEPVTVTVTKDTVVVPKFQPVALPNEIKKVVTDQKMQRAVQENLGFLGILGKKNLTKALGGMPTALKDASAGAGPGGKEGSGGESLVGLGQGLKRITVGNTGVAGLGGIGTKGAGGGAGGYGNAMVGSGEGKKLSSIPLSKDMVLDGGLDRSVVQATIAKYLSQVRACYEEGLRTQPGLTGVVAVDFVIGGAGDVLNASVNRSTLGNAPVENCIIARAKTWKFPKPLGGVNVKVGYPFLLRPSGT